jgi:hypothetical protein
VQACQYSSDNHKTNPPRWGKTYLKAKSAKACWTSIGKINPSANIGKETTPVCIDKSGEIKISAKPIRLAGSILSWRRKDIPKRAKRLNGIEQSMMDWNLGLTEVDGIKWDGTECNEIE